jgi:hypothetical protein
MNRASDRLPAIKRFLGADFKSSMRYTQHGLRGLHFLRSRASGGERTRPRVLFPAPSPETFCVRRSWPHTNVFGEGAEDHTRGRVCSPMRALRVSGIPSPLGLGPDDAADACFVLAGTVAAVRFVG